MASDAILTHHPPGLVSPTRTEPVPDPVPDSSLEATVRELQASVKSLQAQVSALTHASKEPTPFRQIFHLASADPHLAYREFLRWSRDSSPDLLYHIARLCITAPVGRVGHRRALRAVANLLLDHLLARAPTHTEAMCLKGEALLPFIYYGKNDSAAPRAVLDEAYRLFESASNHGSPLGLFLKGRWLLSMEPLHKDNEKALQGSACVKAAVQAKCSRALVFLAHRYEYPELDRTVSFANDLPKGKTHRERFILDFYQRAADMGDPDALNDIGTSYAEGYGGLQCDFDKAVDYYVRAIEKGSLHAFDNLGTHYETGMGGRCVDRIDYGQALYYYQQGAKMRCPKCAHNLAAAYEEGMPGTLQRDTRRAENYYRHGIKLADDANDIATASKCIRDLAALYITRIKLNLPESDVAVAAQKRLLSLVTDQGVVDVTMAKVNKAIASALRSKPDKLNEYLGDVNSKLIIKQVRELDLRVKSGKSTPEQVTMLHHTLGTEPPQPESAETAEPTEVGRKRARAKSSGRQTSAVRKRRRKK